MSDYLARDPAMPGRPGDAEHMRRALDEARACLASGDVPVGCVIVRRADGEVVAAAGNARERLQDPTAHAEVLALRAASDATGSWHLEGHTLVVTLEPCAMCAGAAVLARIDRVVFGAADPKAGFAGSLGNLLQDDRLNHRVELTAGVLADECGELLRTFFRERR
jgi:tRNA(adenine34) deaminase